MQLRTEPSDTRLEYYNTILNEQKAWNKDLPVILQKLITIYKNALPPSGSSSIHQKPAAFDLCQKLSKIEAKEEPSAQTIQDVILLINEYAEKTDLNKDSEFLNLLSAFMCAYKKYQSNLNQELLKKLNLSAIENALVDFSKPQLALAQEITELEAKARDDADTVISLRILELASKLLTEDQKEKIINAIIKVVDKPKTMFLYTTDTSSTLGALIRSLGNNKKKWIQQLLVNFDNAATSPVKENFLSEGNFPTRACFLFCVLVENFNAMDKDQQANFLDIYSKATKCDNNISYRFAIKLHTVIPHLADHKEQHKVLNTVRQKYSNDESSKSSSESIVKCYEYLLQSADAKDTTFNGVLPQPDKSAISFSVMALVFDKLDKKLQAELLDSILKDAEQLTKKLDTWRYFRLSSPQEAAIFTIHHRLFHCYKHLSEQQKIACFRNLLRVYQYCLDDKYDTDIIEFQLKNIQNIYQLSNEQERGKLRELFFTPLFELIKKHNANAGEDCRHIFDLAVVLESLTDDQQKIVRQELTYFLNPGHAHSKGLTGWAYALAIPQFKTWSEKTEAFKELLSLFNSYNFDGYGYGSYCIGDSQRKVLHTLIGILTDHFPQLTENLAYEENITLLTHLNHAMSASKTAENTEAEQKQEGMPLWRQLWQQQAALKSRNHRFLEMIAATINAINTKELSQKELTAAPTLRS